MAFPHDSIESAFPVWKFELPEQESASQLGTGAHLRMLQQLDKNLVQTRLFEPELMRLKEAMLEDIQDKKHAVLAIPGINFKGIRRHNRVKSQPA